MEGPKDTTIKCNICGVTDRGRVRQNNEDAFVCTYIGNDKNLVLTAAIDGVGGYEGGEVAAAVAKETIETFVAENIGSVPLDILIRLAVVNANNNIFTARSETQYRQMSCVLTAAIIDLEGATLYMAHIGDTRLYEVCDGTITKLSHDHSVVGYSEEIGELTEVQAMHHPRRNVISRDAGSRLLSPDDSDYIECATFPLPPEGSLLLCSDGLCDMITSEAMKEILMKECPTDMKASSLILAANIAGGRDNVTVVVVDFCGLPEAELVITTERNSINSRQNATTPQADATTSHDDKDSEDELVVIEVEHVEKRQKNSETGKQSETDSSQVSDIKDTKLKFHETALIAFEIISLTAALYAMAVSIFNLHIVQG